MFVVFWSKALMLVILVLSLQAKPSQSWRRRRTTSAPAPAPAPAQCNCEGSGVLCRITVVTNGAPTGYPKADCDTACDAGCGSTRCQDLDTSADGLYYHYCQ